MGTNSLIANFRRIVTTQYFDFNGRTRRRDFWFYILAYVLIMIVLSIIESALGLRSAHGESGYYSSGPLTGLLGLALLLPSLGVSARRLHDADHSAWWLLLNLIPVLGWLVLLYWYVQRGTAGTNQFGADPKADAA